MWKPSPTNTTSRSRLYNFAMLNSFELLGFISPDLSNRILTDTAEDNREVYNATLTGVARLRRMRTAVSQAPAQAGPPQTGY